MEKGSFEHFVCVSSERPKYWIWFAFNEDCLVILDSHDPEYLKWRYENKLKVVDEKFLTRVNCTRLRDMIHEGIISEDDLSIISDQIKIRSDIVAKLMGATPKRDNYGFRSMGKEEQEIRGSEDQVRNFPTKYEVLTPKQCPKCFKESEHMRCQICGFKVGVSLSEQDG